MKKYIFNILLAAGLVMSFAACEQDTIDPLEGIYPKPDHATYTSAVLNGQEKAAATRTLDMTFTGSGAKNLNIKFVVDKYYLGANTYTAKAESAAGKGSYIIPASNLGGSAIEKGGLTVEVSGENWTEGVDYFVSGTVWLTDGSIVRVEASFNMVWEEDIDPDTMSDSVTSLGTADLHVLDLFNAAGQQTATIYVITATGADIAGTYDVAGFYSTMDAGKAWAGYDYSAYGYGVGGTGYYDGGTFNPLAEGGQIVITKNADLSYTIEMAGMKFYGKPAAKAACTETPSGADGVTTHTIVISGADGSTLAQLCLNRADGQSLAGTYSVMSYASADLTAGNGWDFEAYGYGWGGSVYYQDGARVLIGEGETIKVEALGSAYKATVGDKTFIFAH